MIKGNERSKVAQIMFLAVMALAQCQGCTPIDNGELATFAREMLLSAAAAFLL